MSVQNALNAAIYSALTGAGTALTSLLASGTAIYYAQAPDDAAGPFVVWSLQAGEREPVPGDMRNQLMFIRAVASTPATAGSVAAQVETAIHGKALTVSGYTNFWTWHESDYENVVPLPNGEREYISGGLYRFRLDS